LPVAEKIVPQASSTARHCICLIAAYLFFFGILLYFAMWLCSERIHIHKNLDMFGGGFVGLMGGIVCSAALLFIWFSFPFGERTFPVGRMFYPPHKWTFHGITFVSKRISGGRDFDGNRFLRDLRFGLPAPRLIGDGFWVTSVPTGQIVFTGSSASDTGRALDFYMSIKERWGIPDSEIRPSERRQPFGKKGRTPLFISFSSDEAMIAVIMDDPPRDVASPRGADAAEFFYHDGEIAIGQTYVSEQPLYMKIYAVKKRQNVGTLVAMFHPTSTPLFPPPIPGEAKSRMDKFMPLQECFQISPGKASMLKNQLKSKGATAEEAEHMIKQLRYCGKAVFVGLSGRLMAVEMMGHKLWKVFDVQKAVDLEKEDVSEGRRRRRRR